jgi:hypothetical protein
MLGELCGPSAHAIRAAQTATEHKKGREISRIAFEPYSRILDCICLRVRIPVMLLRLGTDTRGVGDDGLETPAFRACALYGRFVVQIRNENQIRKHNLSSKIRRACAARQPDYVTFSLMRWWQKSAQNAGQRSRARQSSSRSHKH